MPIFFLQKFLIQFCFEWWCVAMRCDASDNCLLTLQYIEEKVVMFSRAWTTSPFTKNTEKLFLCCCSCCCSCCWCGCCCCCCLKSNWRKELYSGFIRFRAISNHLPLICGEWQPSPPPISNNRNFKQSSLRMFLTL